MRIFTKYLFKDQVKPTITALVVLLSIVWLMQSLRFMDYIVNKGLDVSTFLWITVLVIPSLLIVILPLSLFAGATFSYKRLNDDNELSAFFASGQSRWRIIWPSMFMATIVMTLCYSITLWFMPAGMSSFKALQHDIREGGGNILLEEGAFNQMGADTMVYIRKKHPNYKLDGILVHDTQNPQSPITWMAESGRIIFSDKGYPSLVLHKGTRQEVSGDRLSVLEFEKHTVDIMRQIAKPTSRKRGAQELYLGELLNTEDLSDKDASEYKAEFHKRLLWPFSVFPLVLIPACVLIRTRSRRFGSVRPATIATLIAFCYQALIVINHNIANKGSLLFLYGQWVVPIGVCIICCIIISDRQKEEEAF
ncbi:MAG: lipopolysaccharide export system permease protein [Alphaproteobacteria bacterium]